MGWSGKTSLRRRPLNWDLIKKEPAGTTQEKAFWQRPLERQHNGKIKWGFPEVQVQAEAGNLDWTLIAMQIGAKGMHIGDLKKLSLELRFRRILLVWKDKNGTTEKSGDASVAKRVMTKANRNSSAQDVSEEDYRTWWWTCGSEGKTELPLCHSKNIQRWPRRVMWGLRNIPYQKPLKRNS